MKQRTPTEGKGWLVDSDEMQGESGGFVKEIEKLDTSTSNSPAKQDVKVSKDLSSSAQNKSKSERDGGGGGGGGGAVKEASI